MLSIKNLCFRRQSREILSVPSLEIDPTQITVILGHNGSGKSTFLKMLAGQLRPTSGQILLDQLAIDSFSARELARKIAFLPQTLPDAASMTVQELVGLGRFAWRGMLGRWQQHDHDVVEQAMLATDVLPFAGRLSHELSGGERQRAWIAMLLAQESPLLLLDEPTSALDLSYQYDLMQLLTQLNRKQKKGVIIILHDVNLAARFADRIIAIKQGRVIFDGNSQALLQKDQLHDLYGLPFELLPMQNRLPVAVVAS